MPTGDLPGWHQVFTDDFSKDYPLGTFPYYGTDTAADKWTGYPPSYADTSGNGYYRTSEVISVHDGTMDMWLHMGSDGKADVAAPIPKIYPELTSRWKMATQLYGRYVVRFRSDPIPGYKTAWLLWPDSRLRTDGEIDFPEGNLDGTVHAYMHHQDATSGSDQDAYSTGVTYTSWHTAVIEWLPTRCTFILDGKVIGNSTSRIPATPMIDIMQTETQLSGGAPSPSAQGHVYIDWVAVYAPA